MAYIFMDESGDLGFDQNKQNSKFFIVTFLFIENQNRLDKIIRKVFKSLPLKVKQTHVGYLHAIKEKPKTRALLLKLLSEENISIMYIYLNKSKVYATLKNEVHVLYNYVTNILLDRIYSKKIIPTNQPIQLVASRRETNKFLNENFKRYLKNQISLHHKLSITITIEPSQTNKSLQAVDFISWAIYRKIEHNDKTYIDIIKQKIIEENPLFP